MLPPPEASLLWTKDNVESDDYLHNVGDPAFEKMLDKQWSGISPRGWMNVGALAIILIVIVGLFAGWPIYNYAIAGGFESAATSSDSGWGLGGVNATGQVPKIDGLPTLVDSDTPDDVRKRTGFDGEEYNLVFSDEVRFGGVLREIRGGRLTFASHRSSTSMAVRSGPEMTLTGKLSTCGTGAFRLSGIPCPSNSELTSRRYVRQGNEGFRVV